MTPSFDGELLVFSRVEIILQGCNTQINFNNIFIIGCPLQSFLSNTLNVQTNQSVDVRAEYKLPFTPGTFYHCIEFQQNGMIDCILTYLKISLLDCLSIMVFYSMI